MLDTAGFKRGQGAPPTDTLNQGNKFGKNFIPAECDVSIRPGWFFHQKEDSLVKTPQQLFEIYLKSVGRGANLILNVPPDRRGLITKYDSASLVGFKKLRQESFGNDLSKNARKYFVSGNKKSATKNLDSPGENKFIVFSHPQNQFIQIDYPRPSKINCLVLQENLLNGQQCAKFTVKLFDESGSVIKELNGTTIGHKRILSFPEEEVSKVQFFIDEQKAPARISSIKSFRIKNELIEK
jgi:alpha-L-fucosidase